MKLIGNQHNWWPRILKKILYKQTMSKKEFGYYKEICADNKFSCHSVMAHLHHGFINDSPTDKE